MNEVANRLNDRCRIGILSDTHGWLDPRVETALRGCDVVVHAGDIGDDSLLLSLSAMTDRLVVVAGNNDFFSRWWPVTGRRPQSLAESAELILPGGRLVVEHGHRICDTHHYPKCLRDKHPHARVIVFGHTHRQLLDQTQEPWVVNPGAAGRVRTHGGPGCLILQAAGVDWSLESYRFDALRRTGS